MPIEVRAIRERRKVLTVELGEEPGASLEMEYLPAKASRIDRETLQALAQENAGKPKHEQRLALAAVLCDVMTRWDVTSEGDPLPIDPEAIAREFDDAFVGFCIGAIVEDANAGKVSGEFLNLLGTVTTSPTEGGENSPATKAPPISRSISRSPKSRYKTTSHRGT